VPAAGSDTTSEERSPASNACCLHLAGVEEFLLEVSYTSWVTYVCSLLWNWHSHKMLKTI